MVIPGKQLLTVGSTVAELNQRLLDREIGWCNGTNTLYYKKDGVLVSSSQSVILTQPVSRADVLAAMESGKVPIIRQGSAEGYYYLYPETIKADGTIIFFADGMKDGAGTSKYMYSNPDGTWVYKTLTEMTDAEITDLVDALE